MELWSWLFICVLVVGLVLVEIEHRLALYADRVIRFLKVNDASGNDDLVVAYYLVLVLVLSRVEALAPSSRVLVV